MAVSTKSSLKPCFFELNLLTNLVKEYDPRAQVLLPTVSDGTCSSHGLFQVLPVAIQSQFEDHYDLLYSFWLSFLRIFRQDPSRFQNMSFEIYNANTKQYEHKPVSIESIYLASRDWLDDTAFRVSRSKIVTQCSQKSLTFIYHCVGFLC